MTTQRDQLPNPSHAGDEFNYAQWSAGTSVTLCNVPWGRDYRDIVKFDTQADLDSYLAYGAGPTVNIDRMTYARPGVPVRISLPFNYAYQYNYLRVHNPSQGYPGSDGPRTFYYFITDVEHLATNTTVLMVQLDVWQTFGYGISFGNCYIERGHIGIANEGSFTDFGRAYLSIPEGMDVGGEYQIVKRVTRELAQAHSPNSDYRVLLMSTISLQDDPGTVDNPHLNSATGSAAANLPNGCEFYLFNSQGEFTNYMAFMKDKPWITQGILSVTVVPSLDSGFDIPGEPVNLSGSGVQAWKVLGGESSSFPHVSSDLQGWRDVLLSQLGRYSGLKKFLTYPYCVVEVTAYTGTPIIVKPESWQDPDATMIESGHFIPPGARITLYPYRYNATDQTTPELGGDVRAIRNDGGEFLDHATGIFDFPMFSIVNNGYLSYMAANRNSIAFQHQSADWSQQRALNSANTSYDQAQSGIATSRELNRLGTNATVAQAGIVNDQSTQQMLRGGATGLVKGAMGGPMGIANGGIDALSGAVGNAIDINARNLSTGVAVGTSRAQNSALTGNQQYVADTNRSLAQWAAKGDYETAIAGINAKVQDARLTQPAVSGQLGGDAFNLATHRMGYDIKIKMLSSGAMRAVGEYWLRYGYAVNQFGRMPDSLMVTEKFTYWKLKETYLTSAICPESFKQAIRGIFEKGVTVWKNPSDIGNIDLADNAPLSGVWL